LGETRGHVHNRHLDFFCGCNWDSIRYGTLLHRASHPLLYSLMNLAAVGRWPIAICAPDAGVHTQLQSVLLSISKIFREILVGRMYTHIWYSRAKLIFLEGSRGKLLHHCCQHCICQTSPEAAYSPLACQHSRRPSASAHLLIPPHPHSCRPVVNLSSPTLLYTETPLRREP
jgi:hypothetical protein